MSAANMDGRTVVITGGNAGIGRETAVGLAKMGARVFITSRNAERGAEAIADINERAGREVECLSLDLASFASIRRCAEEILERCPQLHVLVNNAGLVLDERSETAEGFETTFGVNHLGHFLLTDLLQGRLVASAPARVVNLSSDAHLFAPGGLDFDDLQSEKRYWGFRVYARSKLANILYTRELARRLEGTGVTVNAVHPGTVYTSFSRDGDTRGLLPAFYAITRPFIRNAAQGAATSLMVASDPALTTVTGGYFKNCKQAWCNRAARNDEAAARLWRESERLVAAASP